MVWNHLNMQITIVSNPWLIMLRYSPLIIRGSIHMKVVYSVFDENPTNDAKGEDE
jgi:hypothetical protein